MSASPQVKCSTADEVQSLMLMFYNVMEDDDSSSKMENHGKIVRVCGVGNPKPSLFTGPISKVLSLLMQQQQDGVCEAWAKQKKPKKAPWLRLRVTKFKQFTSQSQSETIICLPQSRWRGLSCSESSAS